MASRDEISPAPVAWRGRPVPAYLAAWFDQLVQSRPIFDAGFVAERQFCDVVLTLAGGSRDTARPPKPPQVIWK